MQTPRLLALLWLAAFFFSVWLLSDVLQHTAEQMQTERLKREAGR